MFYAVVPFNSIKLNEDHYLDTFFTDDPTKAESIAKRKSAKNFGVTEYVILKECGMTVTAEPKEVTVTI